MRKRYLQLASSLLVTLAAIALVACGSNDSGNNGKGGSLSLVAYSTPQEAYEEITPNFGKTPNGEGITFKQSYGASGDQSRAVEEGLPADVVALSLEPDVTKLVKAGLISESWNKDKYNGFVTNSVVVFAVRKGNPKGIKTWEDLINKDVDIITPNPFSSGGARWNLMAAYGSQIQQGKGEAEGLTFLEKLLKKVSVQDKSARDSLQTFSSGKGDVLLAYENEAINAQKKGLDIDYIVPEQTILIQNPVAVTSNSKSPQQAKAFTDYLRTPAAQKVFASHGYRPVLSELADESKFPTPTGLFEIDKFGGWAKVMDEFFDPNKGKVAEIYKKLGVSTAKK